MAALLIFVRFLIGGTFLLSALSKVRSPAAVRAFADSLVELRLARPGRSATVLALAVAAAEALAVSVVVPLGTTPSRLGFLLAIGLLTAFTVVIVRSIRRHEMVACRCFGGSASAPFSGVHVARNTGLLLAAVIGIALAAQSAPWPMWAVMAPAGAVCAFIVSRLDEVVALFRTA